MGLAVIHGVGGCRNEDKGTLRQGSAKLVNCLDVHVSLTVYDDNNIIWPISSIGGTVVFCVEMFQADSIKIRTFQMAIFNLSNDYRFIPGQLY